MPSASTICSLAKLTFWRSMYAIRESSPRKGIRRREILPISCFSTIIGSPWVCLFVLVAGRRRARAGRGWMHSSRHLSGVAGGGRPAEGPVGRGEPLARGRGGGGGALRGGAVVDGDARARAEQAFAVAQQVFHALHHEDDGRQHLAVLAFGVRF